MVAAAASVRVTVVELVYPAIVVTRLAVVAVLSHTTIFFPTSLAVKPDPVRVVDPPEMLTPE
jgi:hypothetical protein